MKLNFGKPTQRHIITSTDNMTPALSEDDIDDLIYLSRTGDIDELNTLKAAVCQREKIHVTELLELVKDENTGNGVLHMAAANGHHGKAYFKKLLA
jgi:hypothetical protein